MVPLLYREGSCWLPRCGGVGFTDKGAFKLSLEAGKGLFQVQRTVGTKMQRHQDRNMALWCSLVLTADYEEAPVKIGPQISEFPDLLPFWASSTECPLMMASSSEPSPSYNPPAAEHDGSIPLLIWILFSWIQSPGFFCTLIVKPASPISYQYSWF